MGLFDLDMSNPEAQGFNSALMQAAAALLTPRHRGGGVGSAFAAFPQAIDRAKANAMREQLMALQGRQVGLQTDKLGFDMEQAKAQQAAAEKAQRNRAEFLAMLQGGRVTPDLIPHGLSAGFKPEELKELAGAQNWGREPLQFVNGVPVDKYTGLPAANPINDPNKPFGYGPLASDGSLSVTGNPLVQNFELGKARAGAASQSVNNFVMPSTPGQKKADEKFGVDFVDFATGGYADVMKQLDQLREASATLGSGKAISGPIMGNMPDSVLAVTNPQAVATKEAIQEVAQRNLRLILGAQFTEKEGERLIARVFNPRLSETENKKRVDRLIKQIGDAAKAKLDAAQYFQKHGSLTGWQGRLPRLSDFDPDFGKKEGGASGSFDKPEQKRRTYNPATGMLE